MCDIGREKVISLSLKLLHTTSHQFPVSAFLFPPLVCIRAHPPPPFPHAQWLTCGCVVMESEGWWLVAVLWGLQGESVCDGVFVVWLDCAARRSAWLLQDEP